VSVSAGTSVGDVSVCITCTELHWRRPRCCCQWTKAWLIWTTSGVVVVEIDLSSRSLTRLARLILHIHCVLIASD